MTTIANYTRDDGSALLVLSGEIDMARVGDIDAVGMARLTDADATLLVDMMDVTFIDVAGLDCLLKLRNAATARGARLVLLDPPAAVLRLLDLTNLNDVFDISGGRRSS